jgi:hypothetical protein
LSSIFLGAGKRRPYISTLRGQLFIIDEKLRFVFGSKK